MKTRTVQRLTKIEKRLEQLECKHLFHSPVMRSWIDSHGDTRIVYEEQCAYCDKVIQQLNETEYYQQKLDDARDARRRYVYVSS